MPDTSSVREQMRADWNARAVEDAHYYVAFGRKNQEGDEFFETGLEQVRGLELELKRLSGTGPWGCALEIGCGPGRLMRPMAKHFAEIHGLDVSDEMVARARRNLESTPNATPHHTPDSTLAPVAEKRFDFIYSYAVFQHIPSREVVMGYLTEAAGLLNPGGIIRAQLNGLPQTGENYTTWSGVRIAREEIAQFARERGLQLLALEGAGTQYMWTTLRKPVEARPAQPLRIRRITNADSGEPVAPVSGRFAALSIWVEGFGSEADLNDLAVEVAGKHTTLTYLGPPERDGLRQLNLMLPEGLCTGIAKLELHSPGGIAPAHIRLIPAPPRVMKLVSVTDGVDLVSGYRIVSGLIKATVQEINNPDELEFRVAGTTVTGAESFRTDPRLPEWEINFPVPASVPPGPCAVEVRHNGRVIASAGVEITAEGK